MRFASSRALVGRHALRKWCAHTRFRYSFKRQRATHRGSPSTTGSRRSIDGRQTRLLSLREVKATTAAGVVTTYARRGYIPALCSCEKWKSIRGLLRTGGRRQLRSYSIPQFRNCLRKVINFRVLFFRRFTARARS